MLTDLFISHHKRVAGIEIHFHSAQVCEYFITILSYEKGKLLAEKQVGPVKNFAEVLTLIKPTTPVYITINGKVILSRKGNVTSVLSIEALFPGLNKEEFYIDTNEDGFVVVARKKIIDDCIEQFNEKGFRLAGVKLGPIVSENVYPLLQLNRSVQQTINAGYSNLVFMGEELSQFDLTPTLEQSVSYSLTGSPEQIGSNYLISYATALQGYLQTSTALNVAIASVKANTDYWRFKLFIRKWGSRFVAVLCAILLINTLFYFNIFTKHKEVKQRFEANQYLLQRVDTLELEIKEKEEFLLSNGIEQERSLLALYADRIASTIPSSISLTQLSMHAPKGTREKEQKFYSYDANVIAIKGTCRQDVALNNWIKAMKGLSFVHDVTIHGLSKDINSYYTSFEMELILK